MSERRTAEEWAEAAGLKRKGSEWVGPCPLCGGDDRFHVRAGQNGDALVGCRGCMDGQPEGIRRERFTELLKTLWQGEPTQSTVVKASTPPIRVDALPNLPTWFYHDANGRRVLAVCRRDWTDRETGAKRKSYPNYVPDGEGWLQHGLGDRRPLYDLPHLLSGSGRVYIVEGEKCVDAVRAAWPQMTVTTWSGGANAWGRTDFSPLARRQVTIISDPDEPGRRAARAIGLTLNEIGAEVRLVLLPDDSIGDIADLLDNHGTDETAKTLAALSEDIALPPSEPEPVEAKQTVGINADAIRKNEHFAILGLADQHIAIRLARAGQIIQRTREQMVQPSTLIALAPEVWWCSLTGASELGARVSRIAGDAIIRTADALGQIDLSHVYGRGAVRLPDAQVAYHLGDRILHDGHERPIDWEPPGVFWLPMPRIPLSDSADDEAMKELAAALMSYRWRSENDGRRMLGWMVAAIVGGSLRWRPHIALIAPSASGKSWLVDRLEEIMSGLVIKVADATPAGLARYAAHSSLPIIIDEAEAGSPWVIQIMSELRRASGGDALRLRAASHGDGASMQSVRFAAMLSATTAPRLGQADASRISRIALGRPVDDWLAVERRITTAVTNIGAAFRARIIRDAAEITKAVDVTAKEYMGKGLDSRLAMGSAALTVGWWWWQLGAEEVFTHDLATGRRAEADAVDLLNEILSIRYRDPSGETDLLTIISRADDMTGASFGVKRDGQDILIDPNHPGLMRALRRSAYEHTELRSLLLQIDGSTVTKNPLRFGQRKGRAVHIPADTLERLGISVTQEEGHNASF